MNHAQLKAFHAVAETGGFSAAAKILGLTQPAITLQVQALEQSYNTKLFIRRGRYTEITASGKMLLDLSKRIFNLEEEAHILLSSLDKLEAGNLRISAASALHSFPALSAFGGKYPAIGLDFTTAPPLQLEKEILAFRSDIIIDDTAPDDSRFFSLKIREAPLKLAISTRHPWAKRKAVSLRDIEEERLLLPFDEETTRQRPGHWSHRLDCQNRKILRLDNKEIGREAVAHNLGVLFLTEQDAEGDKRIQLLDIRGQRLKEEIYVTCHAELRHSRLIAAFIDTALSL